jgi:predicted nucleic acid-binding Zn ribbon protein
MSDSPIQKCSVCNNKLRRLVSGGTGLIFKGSGFYLTDYAKNKSNNSGKSEDKKPDKNSTKKKSKK